MDDIDRALVNVLQDGVPVCRRPYDELCGRLGIDPDEFLDRIENLLEKNILSRFGPMFDAEKLGGAVTLCAMQVPQQEFDRVADLVNAFPEVAHNYAREHTLNMWFVIATEVASRIEEVKAAIARQTGCRIYDMPKLAEFYIGLRLPV